MSKRKLGKRQSSLRSKIACLHVASTGSSGSSGSRETGRTSKSSQVRSSSRGGASRLETRHRRGTAGVSLLLRCRSLPRRIRLLSYLYSERNSVPSEWADGARTRRASRDGHLLHRSVNAVDAEQFAIADPWEFPRNFVESLNESLTVVWQRLRRIKSALAVLRRILRAEELFSWHRVSDKR